MRLPFFFNFKASDKYAEVRKGTQNSGRLITWFPNVGNFHDIDSHSVLSGSGGRAVPDCGIDTGKSPFPWAELWLSLPLTGFNVWGPGRASGERCASGWKLCCEGSTPTASQGPPSSPLERSHQLAGSLLSAPWAVCVAPVAPRAPGLFVTAWSPPAPERGRLSEHEVACVKTWAWLRA